MFCKKWGANLKSLAKAYRLTRDASGLVHAVKPPVVKGSMYSVTLAPVGQRRGDAKPRDEQEAPCLLHGLAALHKVSDMLPCCLASRAVRGGSLCWLPPALPDALMLGCCVLVEHCCSPLFHALCADCGLKQGV